MSSSSANTSEKLLNFEDQTGFYRNITVRALKIRNQYGGEFSPMIIKHDAPASICGFVATSVSKYCAENLRGTMTVDEINESLSPLVKSGRLVRGLVEKSMKSIQKDRKTYLETYSSNFKSSKEKRTYLKDWVANYEISDLFRSSTTQFDNLYFARWCVLAFPEHATKAKHEEKRRHYEEEPFIKEQTYLEAFNPTRELLTADQFIEKDRSAKNFNDDKPMVFVGDLLGHYVTFVALKVKLENGEIEDTVLLLDSTQEKYLTNYASAVILKMICKVAFPDSIDLAAPSPL